MTSSPNFAFLASHDPYWVVLGAQAERNFAEAPNTTLLELRQLCEQMAQRAAALASVFVSPQESQLDLLRRFEQRGVLTRTVAELFHSVRKAGNAAMHDLRGDCMEALHRLKLTRELAVWFHRSFGNAPEFKPSPFVPPADPNEANRAVQAELRPLREELARRSLEAEQAKALAEENERRRLSAEERAKRDAEDAAVWAELAADYERRYAEELAAAQAQAAAKPQAEVREVVARATKAAEGVHLDEAATRRIIDRKLRDAGWEVDSATITHAAASSREKALEARVAELEAQPAAKDAKLAKKDAVIAEISEEFVKVRKTLGEPRRAGGCRTTRATRSSTSCARGRRRPRSPPSGSFGGSGSRAASTPTGRSGTGRRTSTTPSSRATTGSSRRSARGSSTSTSGTRSRATGD